MGFVQDAKEPNGRDCLELLRDINASFKRMRMNGLLTPDQLRLDLIPESKEDIWQAIIAMETAAQSAAEGDITFAQAKSTFRESVLALAPLLVRHLGYEQGSTTVRAVPFLVRSAIEHYQMDIKSWRHAATLADACARSKVDVHMLFSDVSRAALFCDLVAEPMRDVG